MKTVVIINSERMGDGDPVLGARILQTFFNKGLAVKGLDAIIFYNAAVKLLAEGSEYLPALAALQDNGIEIVACGTCIDHFNLRDKIRVGEIGSMDGIISTINDAAKAITL